MKTKLLSLALSLVILLGVLSAFPVMATNSGYTAVSKIEGAPVVGTTYAINNADDLKAFMTLPTADNNWCADVTFVVTDDIDLNPGWTASATAPTDGYTWTPIQSFYGVLDGGNHTLKGFYAPVGVNPGLTGATQVSSGIFASIGCSGENKYTNNGVQITAEAGGVVKNLTVSNSYFCSTKYAGAIAGSTDAALRVDNTDPTCIINVKVSEDVTVVGNGSVGGVIGNSYPVLILNGCDNYATVQSASDAVGGLVGNAQGNIFAVKCINYANINVSAVNVGGLVGKWSWAFRVTSSANYGDIAVTGQTTAQLGGIGGLGNGTGSGFFAVDSVNIGDLQTPSGGNIGGLVAAATSNVQVTRSANVGTITVTGTVTPNCGGILGSSGARTTPITFLDCVTTSNINVGSNAPVGGLIGVYQGSKGNFTRCLVLVDTVTSTGSYKGAFIGNQNCFANTGTYTNFTDCYYTCDTEFPMYIHSNNLQGRVYTINGTALSITPTGYDTIRNTLKTEFEKVSKVERSSITDLNAIKNLPSTYDFTDATNGWKLATVDGVSIPVPVSVAAFINANRQAKSNDVDFNCVQEHNSGEKLRFISTVDPEIECDAIGFDFVILKDDGTHAKCSLEDGTVYTSLTYEDKGVNSYVVEGKNLGALVFENVPTEGVFVFEAKAFSKVGDVKTYDDAYIVVVENGDVVMCYMK